MEQQLNTVSMGQAYSLLGFQIVEGVVGAGYPQKPKHSAVFAQISPDGSRLTELARKANMTPQAMGELSTSSWTWGTSSSSRPQRRPGETIVLTKRGRDAVAAGRQTIEGIEEQVTEILGERGHRELRRLLSKLLDARDG